MWVFINKAGFFSAVEDTNNPQQVIVRARCRAHAENLADATGGTVQWTPDADYCARVSMTKATWASFLAVAGLGIDYHNCKNELVGDDDAYHIAMFEVWEALNNYQGEKEGVGLYVKKKRLPRRKS